MEALSIRASIQASHIKNGKGTQNSEPSKASNEKKMSGKQQTDRASSQAWKTSIILFVCCSAMNLWCRIRHTHATKIRFIFLDAYTSDYLTVFRSFQAHRSVTQIHTFFHPFSLSHTSNLCPLWQEEQTFPLWKLCAAEQKKRFRTLL